MSARKIGFLALILAFGGIVEIAWHAREDHFILGPEGFRILGGRFYGPSFAFEESAEREVEAGQPIEVDVRNSFGGVRVVPGTRPAVQVVLRKVVFQPTEEKARAFANRIELRLEEQDGHLRIGTNRDELGRAERVGFETHLELRVPPTAGALIRNDHGRVETSGIARADVRASFDDVRVERIAGSVHIHARQGAVEAVDLGADLEIKSRHGDVEVSNVAGPAQLDVQHGALSIRKMAGVEAKVAYGHFAAEGVGGQLRLDGRHTGVRIADVSGSVDVQTSYEGIVLERIGGDVLARVDHGGVSAEAVEGEIHVRARGDDVTLDGVRGPVEVEADGGDVRLGPAGPITQAVTVSAKRGEVRIDVPAASRFDLDAASRAGEVIVDVPEFHRSPSDLEGHVRGTIGGGGAQVRLTADDDILLAPGASRPPAERP